MAKPQKSTAQSEVPGLVKKGPLYYLKRDWQLYALMLLPMVFIIVFKYFAYTGLSVAFLDYKIGKGYAGSKFVGLKIFEKVFKHRDFTKGRPLNVIFSFALPLLMGNLFNQLYNVVDTAIVGRALGADALAAVGSTGNINACLFLLLAGLATGVSVIVSQYWGAERYDELRRLLGTFLTLLLAASVVMSLLGARLAFASLLAPHLGVWGIWLATPLSWASGCIIPVVRYYSKEWMKRTLI